LQALSVALKSFVRPVHDALTALDADPAATLRALTSLLAATTECCGRLAALFADVEARVLASLAHPLLQPYESFIGDYARLETAVLSQEVRASCAAYTMHMHLAPLHLSPLVKDTV
jgi:hypothetical protein